MDRQEQGIRELFQDLQEDCSLFDQGKERKAKDIAGRIRTLLKDGPNKNTISILTQLNRKEIIFKDSAIQYNTSPSFSYFDITGEISNNVINVSSVYMGLVFKKMVGNNGLNEFSCAPLFQRVSMKPEIKEKSFIEWWEQIIYEDPYSNYKLSRKDLILSSSEKDGYAHFDPKLNAEYEKFLQSDSLELVINGQKIKFSNNPAKNSIRQIGYEVIETMKENLFDILK